MRAEQSQSGFTLIEVLVASFILFMVITTMTLVYRGAMLSSRKATETVEVSSLIQPISDEISSQVKAGIQESHFNDKNQMGPVTYSWKATQIDKKPGYLRYNDFAGGLTPGSKTFYLWLIEAEIMMGEKTHTFSFYEVSW